MRRSTALALAAIFVVALGLRLAWVGATDTVIPPLSDPQHYHATASNLADGRGYTVAVDERGFVAGEEGEPTAFWAPGYPFALAPLYAAFGSDERVAKAFNAVVGALTVVPVFALARKTTSNIQQTTKEEDQAADKRWHDRAGLVAAFLFAVCPALILWTPTLFSEALFTFGVACTLAVGVWASERRSLFAWVLVGLVLGATAFVRSQGLMLFVPVVVLAGASAHGRQQTTDTRQQTTPDKSARGELRAEHRQRWRSYKILSPRRLFDRFAQNDRYLRSVVALACVAGGVAVLVVPWAVRNQRAMGEPWLINNNLGYNLRLAHAPYSTGTSIAPRDLWDERPGISFHERELFWDEVGASRAWAYARTHPGREVELAAKRVGWLLRSDAAPAMRWSESLGATPVGRGRDALVLIGDVFWYALVAVAAASLFVLRRDRVWWAMWSMLGAWVALHLVFAGEPRYHVPVVPVLCVLAGGVIATLARETQRHRGTENQSEPR